MRRRSLGARSNVVRLCTISQLLVWFEGLFRASFFPPFLFLSWPKRTSLGNFFSSFPFLSWPKRMATFSPPFRSFPDQSEGQLFSLLSLTPKSPSCFSAVSTVSLVFFFNSVRQVSQRFSEEKLRLAFYSVKTSRETTTECHWTDGARLQCSRKQLFNFSSLPTIGNKDLCNCVARLLSF